MGETIESFVAKLQTEGVQAGRQEADEIIADARRRAEQLVKDAERRAEEITASASAEAENILARSRTELQLAARDAAGRLREALSRAIQAILTRGAEQALTDEKFLSKLLHELVLMYARSDIAHKEGMKINVPPEIRDKLADWALGEIGRKTDETEHIHIDLKGTLSQAGFEYAIDGGTVEVTVASVVEILSQLVSPPLREVLDKASNIEAMQLDRRKRKKE